MIMEEDNDADDSLVLSTTALDALREFYADQDAREKQFEDLKAGAVEPDRGRPSFTMEAFAENWNESQFWYTKETATTLASQLLANTSKETVIAVVSAPSVFIQLKNILSSRDAADADRPTVYLLEFDRRFEVFPEFVFYDFQKPLSLPASLKGTIDRIICDPPFLSDDCQTKAALTVRWLSKTWNADPDTKAIEVHSSSSSTRLVICTGERMEILVKRLYRPPGVSTTTFEPAHAKGLSNEFCCYANFECDDWHWK